MARRGSIPVTPTAAPTPAPVRGRGRHTPGQRFLTSHPSATGSAPNCPLPSLHPLLCTTFIVGQAHVTLPTLASHAPPPLLSSLPSPQGAATSLHLATSYSVEGVTGKYWVDCRWGGVGKTGVWKTGA